MVHILRSVITVIKFHSFLSALLSKTFDVGDRDFYTGTDFW